MKTIHLLTGSVAAMLLLIAPCPAAMAQSGAKDDHDHSGHNHAHDHGKVEDLGTTTVAGVKLSVSQLGEIKAGGEVCFEIALAKSQEKPKSIRTWVGVASAEGSVKARAKTDSEKAEVHVEIPKQLSKDAQFWLEVEPAKGKKAKTAFDLKRD